MKKTILMFAAAGLMLATPSCKKGENDPFMSLSSRKGRLAGTWNLTTADWSNTNSYDSGGMAYVDIDTWSYDGTSLTYNFSQSIDGTAQTAPAAQVDTYSVSHTFGKDGAYDYSSTTNGNTWTSKGWWSFVGKSKTTELKKKEAVLITNNQTVSGGNTTSYTGNSMFPDGYMLLDRLTKKEMITMTDQSTTYSNGDTYASSGTWTFAKQ
jgi:hypothetical protein